MVPGAPGSRAMWATIEGGLGLVWIATRFVEILTDLGIDSTAINTMLRTNPATFLAFDPAAAGSG